MFTLGRRPQPLTVYLGGGATCEVDRLLPPAEFRQQVLQHLLAAAGAGEEEAEEEEAVPAPASAAASGGPKRMRRRLDPVLLDLGRAGNQAIPEEEEGPRRSKRLCASRA